MIEVQLSNLADVDVVVFAREGAPASADMVTGTRPAMALPQQAALFDG